MEIAKFRSFLLDRGMVYFYAVFIAGYFLLPMAAGHRNLYYILVFPAVLLLWRELVDYYRDNLLAKLVLVYIFYMLSTLAWTSDYDTGEALATIGYALALLSFCWISGYLWTEQARRMDMLAHRSIWLAAAAALVSIIVWYSNNPFPSSRVITLGVMHHENKASCAYGLFLLLCVYYLYTEPGRARKLVYGGLGLVLLALVLFTQSRTALAAVSIGLLVMFGYRMLGILVLASAASWALLASNSKYWWHRVGEFSFRPGIWKQVIADMEGHWWFGHGYLLPPQVSAYDKVFDHAHNSYLATLRDGGVVGLALLLTMLAVAVTWAWRLNKLRGERIYLALILYAMTCIAMDYDRLLVHPKELWLFFWLPVALTMAAYSRRDDPMQLRYHGRIA
jgi:O-antigen ligase